MSRPPSLQFYPADWKKDPALTDCDAATRGIWMDLLCSMHENNRCGQLCGTLTSLARHARCSTAEMAHAVHQLAIHGAADVLVAGQKMANDWPAIGHDFPASVTVECRRMRREHKEREQAAARQDRKRRGRGRQGETADITPESRSLSSSSTSVDTEEESTRVRARSIERELRAAWQTIGSPLSLAYAPESMGWVAQRLLEVLDRMPALERPPDRVAWIESVLRAFARVVEGWRRGGASSAVTTPMQLSKENTLAHVLEVLAGRSDPDRVAAPMANARGGPRIPLAGGKR